MRQALVWASVLALAVVGCKPTTQNEGETTGTAGSPTSQTVPEGMKLVKLKLPGMT